MTVKKNLTLGALALAALAVTASAATYEIDPVHSSVAFEVTHLMISKVRGEFNEFSGSFEFDPEHPQKASAQVSVQMASVDTRNEKRDEHLRSPDFFNVDQHPTMSFKATRLTHEEDDEYKLHGELTLNGVTKDVSFDVEYSGQVTDPWGNTRVGFAAEGEIDRKDFGVDWSQTLDSGGVVVGDEVEIEIDIEGVLKK
jgi:polyisoprenoid-binding protein YceI